jgi:hypothetical protein
MALQGEAKKLYHREYMRRQRAGLPTRGVVKPKVMEQWCSECVLPRVPSGSWSALGAATASASAATRRPELCSPRSAPCAGDEGRRTPPSMPSTCWN